MALNVKKVDVWEASVEDRPGGLADKLSPLAEAGPELEFVLARRAPEKPGTAVVFLSPVKGSRQTKAAQGAGFNRSEAISALHVEGPDRPGLGAKITRALADKGINLRGFCASVIGKRFVLYLALDTSADAAKAARVLKGVR